MKNYIIILFLFIATLFSCEDELQQTPPSDLSVAGFFTKESEFIQAVNGTYESLRSYPERSFHLSDVRSDNIYGVSSMGVRSHDPVNSFANTLSTNEYMDEAWNNNYQCIMRANTVLENLKASPGIINNDALALRLEAEVKFLRAFCYFDLVRIFGKVPLIKKVVIAEEALLIPRSPVTDIYDLIIEDLGFAITNLDEYYPKGDENCGRATKNAARGILARVYLTRSGETYNIEGPGLGLNEYQLALDQLNNIISSGNYAMVDDYESIFTVANENNDEIVWDIQFINGGLGVGASYPGDMAGSGYWKSFGVPFAIGLETKDVSEYLIGEFDTLNDVRFDASVTLEYFDEDTNKIYDPTCSKFCSGNPDDWGVDRFDFPINFPVLRYTDVLMMKAECILKGANGTQAEVNTIIGDVRTRAGLTGLTGDATLDDLLDERQKEFLGEGLRWHDLVRNGKVLDVINAWIPVEDVKEQMRQNFPINANHIIYPVPLQQMEVKEGLYEQNPGYE
jgi:hypothetical protein